MPRKRDPLAVLTSPPLRGISHRWLATPHGKRLHMATVRRTDALDMVRTTLDRTGRTYTLLVTHRNITVIIEGSLRRWPDPLASNPFLISPWLAIGVLCDLLTQRRPAGLIMSAKLHLATKTKDGNP